MDYSTQNTMSSLQDLLLVGQQSDLSRRYVNNSVERMAGSCLTRLFGTTSTEMVAPASMVAHKASVNGNHRSISSSGGSESEDDDLDMRSEDIVTLSDDERTSESVERTTNCSMIKNEVKLSFSVENILSGEVERRAERKRRMVNQMNLQYFQSTAKFPRLDESNDELSRMNSAAHATDISSPIYRPMPMRYLQTTPPVPFANSKMTHGNSDAIGNLFRYTDNATASAHQQFASAVVNNLHNIHYSHPLDNFNLSNVYATSSPSNSPNRRSPPVSALSTKRKRSWSRAVFSQLQRKGLEIQFQIQKYITKPDRRKLAARLGLTDAQVKVWFQNRRMKWRHTHENRKNQVRQQQDKVKFDEQQLNEPKGDCSSATDEEEIESYCISSDDEIDVGIE